MNLLVTGAWQQAADYIEQLRKEHEVVFMQWENKDLPCEYEWVEGIIGNGIFLSHQRLLRNGQKTISLLAAGLWIVIAEKPCSEFHTLGSGCSTCYRDFTS